MKNIRTFATRMEKMDTYKIDLLGSFKDEHLQFDLDDDFFAAIDGLVQRGTIKTDVDCKNTGSMYKFNIHSEGIVIVPCDRCLADLELRIDTTDELVVKLGEEYSDDGDCVVVPEAEGYVDLAQFIYEFIALSMPITCTHEPGKCDDSMMLELSKHQTTRSGQEDEDGEDSMDVADNNDDDSDDENIDPRWAALKNLR